MRYFRQVNSKPSYEPRKNGERPTMLFLGWTNKKIVVTEFAVKVILCLLTILTVTNTFVTHPHEK